MLTIETDQGPFLLKVTPTKAHFRSGTAVGRCWGALEDHKAEPEMSATEAQLGLEFEVELRCTEVPRSRVRA